MFFTMTLSVSLEVLKTRQMGHKICSSESMLYLSDKGGF
jgi:hypothetical protein